MARLPRDLSGRDLARAFRRYGYAVTRETGSHLRLTTLQGGEHHVTIPDHGEPPRRHAREYLGDVAAHLGIDRATLTAALFDV